MKRSELRRLTPLRTKRPLLRHELVKARATRLAPVSKKRRQKLSEFEKAKKMVDVRSRGLCEVRTPACPPGAHRGHHHHHVQLRSRGGSDDPSNLVLLCWPAHGWTHDNPEAATALGLMLAAAPKEENDAQP